MLKPAAPLLLCLLLLLSAAPAVAETAAPAAKDGTDAPGTAKHKIGNTSPTLIVYVENDKFTGTDEQYTNGLKVTWITKDLAELADQGLLPEWFTDNVLNPLDKLSLQSGRVLQRNIGLSLGHNIYTPENTETGEFIDDDRPYAGWLYVSLALHSKDEYRLDTFETTVGVVGPSSLGEEVQSNFHSLIGVDRAHGWRHQLKDEPGLMFTWLRTYRAWQSEGATDGGFGCDFLPNAGVTVGNIYTYANAGFQIRGGWNLPADFGTSTIMPGGGVQAPLFTEGEREKPRFGIHLFAGAEGRYVLRDIFLDGNTWQDSPSVDKKPFVADVSGGVAMRWGNYKISYQTVYRTKQFEGQARDHLFGSITLSLTF